ncbi:MAG: 50S ribosomal protein L7/L12, partial [Patescibacteria group bacterium]
MAEEKVQEETKKEEVKLSKASAEIMAAVEKMSVLELNDLVKALEEKFGVSAAAMAAPVAASPAGVEAAPAVEEKAAYDVVLTASGDQKIAVIKAVREINPNLGLAEAKALVDAPGKPIVEGVKKEEAAEAKKKL